MFAKPSPIRAFHRCGRMGETVRDGMTDGRVPKSCAYCHSGVPSPRKNGGDGAGWNDGRERGRRKSAWRCITAEKSTRGAPFCKTDGHAKGDALGGVPALFDKVSRLRLRHFSWERRFKADRLQAAASIKFCELFQLSMDSSDLKCIV